MVYKVYTLRINLSIINHRYDSTFAAYTIAKVKPSHVINALGYDEERAYSSIRFGLGRFTTEEEIEKVIEIVMKAITKLKNI